MSNNDQFDSGFAARHLEPGAMDFGKVDFPERLNLSKILLSYLDGEAILAWRLTWADELTDDPAAVDHELWLSDEQATGLCELKGRLDIEAANREGDNP